MQFLNFSVLFLISFLTASQAIVQDDSALTVCFFSNWAIWRPGVGRYSMDDIPGELCSHIVYGFVGFSETSPHKITEMKPKDDTDPNGIRKFSELRTRFPRTKLLAGIGGWDQDPKQFSTMVSNRNNRKEFIKSVVSLLNAFRLDGITIYWMWPGHAARDGVPEDKANLAALLREMSDAFGKDGQGKLITVMSSVEGFRVDEGYDVADICQSVDYIYLPTFDLRGSWNSFVDVHTPMQKRPFDTDAFKNLNVADGVTLWIKRGCPAGKLILTIATSGRSYTLENPRVSVLSSASKGAGIKAEFTKTDGYMSYYEICKRVQDGWPVGRDPVVPYITKGDQWIGYDDVDSLKEKATLIRERGLAGALIWTLDMDDFRGSCGQPYPLTGFISSEMKKIPSVTSYHIAMAFERE